VSASIAAAGFARSAAALLLGLAIGFAGARGRASGVSAGLEAEAPRVATGPAAPRVAAPTAPDTQTIPALILATSAPPLDPSVAIALDALAGARERAAKRARAAGVASSESEAGVGRIVGHVRTARDAPVAGVRVGARRVPEGSGEAAAAARRRARSDMSEEGPESALVPDADDALGERGATPLEVRERAIRRAVARLVDAEQGTQVVVTAADGSYAIEGLAPGLYEVTGVRDGWSVLRIPSEEALAGVPGAEPLDPTVVRAAEEATADLVATREHTVRVEGSTAAGAAVEWGRVEISGPRDTRLETLPGTVSLPPGLYVVRALPSLEPVTDDGHLGFPLGRASRAFLVEEERAPGAVVLDAPTRRAITGRVTSDTPEAEPWSSVEIAISAAGAWRTDGGVAPDGAFDDLVQLRYGGGSLDFDVADVAPGAYEVRARRQRPDGEPSEAPGPPTLVEVPEAGIVGPIEVRLPPQGRVIRVDVVARDAAGAPLSYFEAEIERRAPEGPDGRPASYDRVGTSISSPGGDTGFARHLLVRPSEVSDPHGRPTSLFVVARVRKLGSAEAPLPPGDDVRVTVRFSEAARLALTIDRRGHDVRAADLSAVLESAGHPGGLLDQKAIDASGKVAFDPCTPGPCVLRIRRQGVGERGAATILERTITLAPGDNTLETALPDLSPVVLEGVPRGALKLYPAGSAASVASISDVEVDVDVDATGVAVEVDVDASGGVVFSGVLPGRYVARLDADDADPQLMAIVVPLPEGVARFTPAAPEGWGARVKYRCGCRFWIGLQDGDVVVAADGRPLASSVDPFPAAMPGSPPGPDPVRLDVVRGGRARAVLAPLAKLREMSASGDFHPVPLD